MKGRLWYPQLDAYDAVRRFGTLLSLWKGEPISLERLFIWDFFFANSPLLHKIRMLENVRKEFFKLEIGRPEDAFLSYPAPHLLFHKMESMQRQAFQTLIGSDLLDYSSYEKGLIKPSAKGVVLFNEKFLPMLSSKEAELANFIVNDLSKIGASNIQDLRDRTGLRRAL
ncbi:MAG: hypothetical protein GC129_02125 [Proteobacteria bacterium]|nr:hypothetical protein [Pseudomonadota bacterium]